MVKEKIIKKYNSKIKELIKHNKLYYSESKPIITDKEYDDLKNEVIKLEKTHNYLKTNNSSNIPVGHKPSKSFEKFKHKTPMLSLSNAFKKEDIIRQHESNRTLHHIYSIAPTTASPGSLPWTIEQINKEKQMKK